MNIGHLSKHQNKPSDTDRYKGYLFTRCVYQINVYTMKRIFEQRSKLYVTECLIVFMYCPVVIMSPPLSFEIKGKHRSKGAFVSPTMLYSTRSL